MPDKPWNGWYHCMGNTYGTWLPGDPRGFRTRGHREHVEGDYKSPPPPGKYDDRHDAAKKRMKRDAVILSIEQREIVCLAMGERLVTLDVELVELSVSAMHFHVLCRFPNWKRPGITIPGLCADNALQDGRDPVPRHLLGLARKNASHVLREKGLKSAGGSLWGKRPRCQPVESERHFYTIGPYIRGHLREGAAVWSVLTGRAQK